MIGPKLRKIRSERGYSLGELAERTGLTASFLSQLERDMTNPSIGTLRDICRALEIPIFHLFIDEARKGQVVRKADRQILTLGESGQVVIELLSPSQANAKLEVQEITLQPGASTHDHLQGHPGEEVAVVLQGQVTVELVGQQVMLDTGDSYCLDSTLPHRYSNSGEAQAQFLLTSTPPV